MSVKINEKMQHLNILLKAAKNHFNDKQKIKVSLDISICNELYRMGLKDDAMKEVNFCISYLQDFIKNQLTRKE